MVAEMKPIRSEADYEAALAEVERLWGAKAGTPKGDRLDVLATLIDAYEAEQHPMDPPDPAHPVSADSGRGRARRGGGLVRHAGRRAPDGGVIA